MTEERRAYHRNYYRTHKEAILKIHKKWLARHPGYNAVHFKEWIKKNPERWKALLEKRRPAKRIYDREFQRLRRLNHPGLKGAEFAAYRKNHPEKVRAHWMLNRAIQRGEVKRSACEVCGAVRVHGHHDDYGQPFKVRWLCPVHHKQAHAENKKLVAV